jgi:hypothetical protein
MSCLWRIWLQGAWYVLSALGLYVVSPGTVDYVLGSPVFRHVRIARSPADTAYDSYYGTSYEQQQQQQQLGGTAMKDQEDASRKNEYLDIIALGTGPEAVYVDQVTMNDKPVPGATIDDPALQRDGVLRFVMRGEQNSHEVEHLVKAIHLTSTAHLEEHLRSGSSVLTGTGAEGGGGGGAGGGAGEEMGGKTGGASSGVGASAGTGAGVDSSAYTKLQKELAASTSAVRSLSAQVATLKKVSGAGAGVGAMDDDNVYLNALFTLCMVLCAIEVLDFVFHLCLAPMELVGNGSNNNNSGGKHQSCDSRSPLLSEQEESEFELVPSNGSGVGNTGATNSSSGGGGGGGGRNMAALNLDDFNSPSCRKVPVHSQRHLVGSGGGGGGGGNNGSSDEESDDDEGDPTGYVIPNTSDVSRYVINYLNGRKYGRGAYAVVLLAVVVTWNTALGLYARAYVCFTGRRPRNLVPVELVTYGGGADKEDYGRPPFDASRYDGAPPAIAKSDKIQKTKNRKFPVQSV